MHDVTHYAWTAGGKPDAATSPSLRDQHGNLAVWRAETPHEKAMAAPMGSALTAIEVYANHGRWIVECPDCHDAQLAVRDDRRFMCIGCANASIGGKWRPVLWPRNHAKIEEILDARGSTHTRNWQPGETVDDLRREELTAEPTDTYEHARWSGLSHEDATAWVAEVAEQKKREKKAKGER